jgi:hypothetical protein
MSIIPDSTIWFWTLIFFTPSMLLVTVTLWRDHQNDRDQHDVVAGITRRRNRSESK